MIGQNRVGRSIEDSEGLGSRTAVGGEEDVGGTEGADGLARRQHRPPGEETPATGGRGWYVFSEDTSGGRTECR